LDKQLNSINNLIKAQKIKKPIIFIDERILNDIMNNKNTEINNILKHADLGLFIHLGSQEYNNLEEIECKVKLILENYKIKNSLMYYDPYRSKITGNKSNIINMFEKIKIIDRNSKNLNSYFER
jgi:hypothetical protein